MQASAKLIRHRKKETTETFNDDASVLLPVTNSSHIPSSAAIAATPASRKSSFFSIESKGINYLDMCLVIILYLLGLFTRLYGISHPRGIAFDELHFTKFTNWYVSGKYYLDIHPPLAKLIMAAFMKYGQGFEGDDPNFFVSYPGFFELYVGVRTLNAVVGSLLVPAVYLSLRFVSCYRLAAFFGAWLACFENIYVLETRLVLTDGYLLSFFALAMTGSFALAKQTLFSWRWLVASFLTGLALGCAISVKFTALGVVGLIGLHQLYALLSWHVFGKRRKSSSKVKRLYNFIIDAGTRGIVILGVALSVLLLSFAVHVWVLPYNGEGNAFMSQEWRNSLVEKPAKGVEGPEVDPYLRQLSLPKKIGELIHTMWVVNLGLRAPHPAGSTWEGWPLMTAKLVPYWGSIQSPQNMNTVGNPFVQWFSFVAMILLVLLIVVVGICTFIRLLRYVDPSEELKRQLGIANLTKPSRTRAFFAGLSTVVQNKAAIGLILFIGYLGNLLPYAYIKRVCFNYHYMPALLVAIHCFGVLIDIFLRSIEKTKSKTARKASILIVVFLGVSICWCFLYFSPWTYGTSLTIEEHAARVWVKTWF